MWIMVEVDRHIWFRCETQNAFQMAMSRFLDGFIDFFNGRGALGHEFEIDH